MTVPFDPYHVWLGIPPGEQPPNHYRLLGLTMFETDANVIANAADRQMSHLRSIGTSKHANLAQRLLNECATAKVCLLKPEKKAAYDNSLRAQLAGNQPPQSMLSAPPTGAFPPVAPAKRRPPPIPARGRGKKQTGIWVASLAGLVVVGGIIGAVIFANSKERDQSNTQVARTADSERDTKTDTSKTKKDDRKSNGGPASESPITPNNVANADSDTTKPNGKSQPQLAKDTTAVNSSDGKANTSAAANSPSSSRFPVITLPTPDAKPFDGMTTIGGWPSGGLPRERLKLDSVAAGKLRPGLILLRYPRQAIQKQEPGAFVLPKDLGSPLGAPTLARGMVRLYFPTNENMLAIGYVRINEPGQYTIGGGNRSGRDTVYLLGEPVVRYGNRIGTRYSRRTLEPGYYPVALAGFADSDGHAGVSVSRRGAGSGGSSIRLGDAVFYHDPNFASNPMANPYLPASGGQLVAQRDIVSRIEPARDIVEGEWNIAGGQLRASASGIDQHARVHLPTDLTSEYDISFRAVRIAGDGPLVIGLPINNTLAAVAIDGWNEHAVGLIDKSGQKPNGAKAHAEACLPSNVSRAVTCSVRTWGVQVSIDGYMLLKAKVNPAEHAIDSASRWAVRDGRRPFVGMRQAGFTLESLVIQPVGQPAAVSTPTTVVTTNPPTPFPNTPPTQRNTNATAFETRKPIPGAEKQQEVEKQVREVFAKDFAAVKKPADRAALAATLLRHAQETKDDPAATYVLLLLTKNTALEAGEAALALRAVDQIVEDYEVDATSEKIAALTKLAATAHQAPQVKTVFDAANELGQELIAQDKYEEAVKAFAAARNMAGKAKETEWARSMTQRIKDLAPLENQYKSVREALAKLEANADDPDANLALGRWHWFVKNRPENAMPHFAKSNDTDLKEAAGKELQNPSNTKAQLEMAGAWDGVALKRRGPEKQPLELRAFHWYLKASAGAQGLDKAKADKRVEEMRAAIKKRLLADAGKSGPLAPEMKSLLSPGLVVEYFADEQLGSRALMKVVENVRTNPLHRNEAKMPQMGQFSARWTGWLVPPKAGTYKITVNYRAALAIDDKLVIAPRPGKSDVVLELSARPHHISYEAANLGWGSMPRFDWQHEDETSPRQITPEFLFHVPLPGEAPAELPVVRPRL